MTQHGRQTKWAEEHVVMWCQPTRHLTRIVYNWAYPETPHHSSFLPLGLGNALFSLEPSWKGKRSGFDVLRRLHHCYSSWWRLVRWSSSRHFTNRGKSNQDPLNLASLPPSSPTLQLPQLHTRKLTGMVPVAPDSFPSSILSIEQRRLF